MGSLGSTITTVLLLLCCSCLQLASAIDTITLSQPINDSGLLISDGSVFKLGFFSPENSTSRYVGIWFNLPIVTRSIIWVANRDKPINDSSGVLIISEDGNLVLLNGDGEVVWSSGASPSRPNSTTAQLLDSGSLVLQDNITGRTVWESFQQPFDSFVQKMEIHTGAKGDLRLTSWKTPSDPSTGNFSVGLEYPDAPELFIWNETRPYWRSGPWSSRRFIGIPTMNNMYLDGYQLVDDNQGTVSLSFSYANHSVRMYYLLTSLGVLTEKYWEGGMEDFETSWIAQQNDCDVYGMCGPFGSCNSSTSPICSCLVGYEPKNVAEWRAGNWSSGCRRSTPLKCERGQSDGNNAMEDGFLQLKTMKVPDFGRRMADLNDFDQCSTYCLRNCSCTAYTFDTDMGCMAWTGNLIDLQKFAFGGADLYVHVAYSELETLKEKGKNLTTTITVTVIIGTIAAAISVFLAWKFIARRRVAKFTKLSKRIVAGETTGEVKIEEVPIFKFEEVQAATNDFELGSKLGEGGFGPVYKGKLVDGRETAVKRLVKTSGQGLKEFMTEVEVISKLQHRNLVRLLGCCAEGDEKMLIYEFMPNGSLDAILFDSNKRGDLDWRKRFNIMEGISRGLLYLHRDSRLKIIHRDIKASNILLDEALNPKISDFGTARIFGGNEDRANTIRVVGTYGYMSPEYAMEGHFSEKSDVYSFGVLVLEIISGRKNTSFYQDASLSLSLLAHTWKLWNEGNITGLADPLMYDPRFEIEIWRCVHVGLLCVQELVKDRPTMSVVVSMLNSEIADLPTPKQPAFTQGQGQEHAGTRSSSQQSEQRCSVGSVTMTTIEGR